MTDEKISICLNNQTVDLEDVVYDIYYYSVPVATNLTSDQLWDWYFAKEREVIEEKRKIGEQWRWTAIGIHGLTMSLPEKWNDEKYNIYWTTRIKLRGKNVV